MGQKYSIYYSKFFHSESNVIEVKFLEIIKDKENRCCKVIILRNNMNNKKLFNICSDIVIYEASLEKFGEDLMGDLFKNIGLKEKIINEIISIKNNLYK